MEDSGSHRSAGAGPVPWGRRRGRLGSDSPTSSVGRASSIMQSISWLSLLLVLLQWPLASAMSPDRVTTLRRRTVDMFYHGFDNYMDISFPEDEVRTAHDIFWPLSPSSSPPFLISSGSRCLRFPQCSVSSLTLSHCPSTDAFGSSTASSRFMRTPHPRCEKPEQCRTERCLGQLLPHSDRQPLDASHPCLRTGW